MLFRSLQAPALDALLDKILLTVDVEERQELALEATRKIIDRHGSILYLFAPYGYIARWNYVRGYEGVEAEMIPYTYDMWLDK